MSHPLIQRLQDEFEYPLLDEAGFSQFAAEHEYSVFLFTEDPVRHKESLDLAVVLPELVAAFPQLKAAVVDRKSEKALQQQLLFTAWPALVFMTRGEVLGNIIRIQNWEDYCRLVPEILARNPQPLVNEASSDGAQEVEP